MLVDLYFVFIFCSILDRRLSEHLSISCKEYYSRERDPRTVDALTRAVFLVVLSCSVPVVQMTLNASVCACENVSAPMVKRECLMGIPLPTCYFFSKNIRMLIAQIWDKTRDWSCSPATLVLRMLL